MDANILIYAYDAASRPHAAARRWLEASLGGVEPIGIPLQSLLAFLRLTTSPSVMRQPFETSRSLAILHSWLDRTHVTVPTPGDRHWEILGLLAADGQARGPQLMDGHLAALTVEHGATLMTTDRGFARFPGLRFENPLIG